MMHRASADRGEGESSGGRGGSMQSDAGLSTPYAPSRMSPASSPSVLAPPVSFASATGAGAGAIAELNLTPVYMVQAGPALFVFPPLASSVVLVSQSRPVTPTVTDPISPGDDPSAGLGNHQTPPPIVPPLLDSVLVETPSLSESGVGESDDSRNSFNSTLPVPLPSDLLAPGLTGSALVGSALLGESLVVADTADVANGSGGDADLMVLPWEDWGSSRDLPTAGLYFALDEAQANTASQRWFGSDDPNLPDFAVRTMLTESLDLTGGAFLDMRDFMLVDYVHDAPADESDGWWTRDASRSGLVSESGDESAARFASRDELFRRWWQPAAGNSTESPVDLEIGPSERFEEQGPSETTRGVEYLRVENGRAVYQVLEVVVAVEDAADWSLSSVASSPVGDPPDGIVAAGDAASEESSSESAAEANPPAAPLESASFDEVPSSVTPADASASPLARAILLPGLIATLFWRRRDDRADATGKDPLRR